MNLERLLMLLVAALVTLSVRAGDLSSAAAGQQRVGHLRCADATLIATTVYLDVDGQDRQTLLQRIALISAGRRVPLVLRADGRLIRQPLLKDTAVLNASATSWACLTGTGGKSYVYVVYTCTESPRRLDCEGDRREWVRLFNTQGKPLNAGFPHDGPRTPELMKRLGLGRYVNDGVQLEDIDN